jgi:hypothetical protein
MTQMNIREGISSDWNCNFVVLEMKEGITINWMWKNNGQNKKKYLDRTTF